LFGLLDVQVDYELSTLILLAIVVYYTVDFKQRLCFCYNIVRRSLHGLMNYNLSVSCDTVVFVVCITVQGTYCINISFKLQMVKLKTKKFEKKCIVQSFGKYCYNILNT